MCVRELSKKTAVSHDRAGFGSPLTAQANLCKVKTLIQKKFILTQRNNMSMNTSIPHPSGIGLQCKVKHDSWAIKGKKPV